MAYEFVPLKEKYQKEVVPVLMKEFGYKNIHEVPRLVKVVINMGVGEGSRNKDVIEAHARELTTIAGQKAIITKAKKSISNFKIRKGMSVGVKVTLRGPRMYNFVYKLVNLVLPKVRDFRGLNPNSFDGKGNYSFGLTEQLVFPEISPDQIKRIQGMDIVVVTTAKRDEEARRLLELLGFPFKKQ
ncbi:MULTISPECIES: 50S ribosomal protein L5 [Fervidobacterium]|uniref:Large ribosomal subunit protein uL5 n=1 Tax=Fervidobacterium nodosum (strain ATCC 35602 / DSM 5306 / Rt17-B1) TaxID=381764 RepID=RL5_FERNB|nr:MULTISPECIES: 50S ribosomal protein L5 [Fervidobacterium]A7HM40.1 RecName: Full=Large ribosomal subunit protein uL5; AltName: Full=50S ribosomal protein L5 [Fervidobacterium nodosum Rt17-B1]PHJ14310.1 50S ribosomal protein L5 [Fervidobacterium sp. SC_NGM5_G05]HOJ94080.1 50S ribosomal protein L5 [Fervidobacterium nodosum]ABS60973.1 ribosomal protein L5 [Fervidobacterium nodosum Rt17-B1]KAF2962300.1 50S ribosomal protein L5 [Fervidobacterium sp. 2310opik-2]